MSSRNTVGAAVLAAACGCSGGILWEASMPVAAKSPTITIGTVLPLTGDAAHWGIPPRNGAELAVDEINRAGGIDGRMLELMIEDDRCQPPDGIAAFNKIMATANPPVILGAVCSSVSLAIAPLAEASRTAMISPASTTPKLTDAGDFIFRVIPSGSLRAQILANYVYKHRNLRRLAALYINNEGGIGGASAFKTQFTRLGGTIAVEETYAQGATDVRAQLSKIKDANVDGVIVGSYPLDTVVVLKQARELDLAPPLFFTTESPQNPEVLRGAGDAANGATYILAAAATGAAPEGFARAYEAKFAHKPELFAAEGYDIVQLIAGAIRAGKGAGVTGSAIRDFLYQVRGYAGASGAITFDRNGDVVKPYAIRTIDAGSPQTVVMK
jgi:branched-chain amino acid transport system substrate-binding protein